MRRILITGGSSAVGKALIETICEDGLQRVEYIYAACFKNDSALEEVSAKYPELAMRLITFQFDLENKKNIVKLLETMEQLGNPTEVIFLAAPRVEPEQFRKNTWEDFKKPMDICLRSSVMILNKVLPFMAKERQGKVIFMLTSYVANRIPPAFLTPYITVKYSLLGLMKCLSAEYADKNIQINAVSPTMMDTPFISEFPEEVKELAAEKSRRKRLLRPDEVAEKIVKLLDPGNTINGKNLLIR